MTETELNLTNWKTKIKNKQALELKGSIPFLDNK